MFAADRLNYIHFSTIRKIFEDVNRLEEQGHKIIHFEIGQPDYDTPIHIKEGAKKALDAGHVYYTSNFGIYQLREALSHKLYIDNGLSYDPKSEIIVTLGVTEALFISLMALVNCDDEILILDPSFPQYKYAVRMAGGKPIHVPLIEEDAFFPNTEKIEKHISKKTKGIIINTPNNPTGCVYNEEALQAVADLAQKYNMFVISDEIYEKLVFDETKHLSIASFPGMRERTITLNGFSKSYAMTGWRLGYAASTMNIISGMVRIHQHSANSAVSFAQYGALAALCNSQDCVKDMVDQFQMRRNLLLDQLEEIPVVSFVRPYGAFYVLVNIKNMGIHANNLAHYLLENAKVAVVPWDSEHIRLSYANSLENIEQGMRMIKNSMKKLHKISDTCNK